MISVDSMKHSSLGREYLAPAKWTSLQVVDRRKHFEIIHVDCREEIFVLQHSLSAMRIMVKYMDLKNKSLWAKGWL